eukprot:TRINITY_DN8846_c0_g1_i1.p1 TRINITY_DN8846_c0_g1~~TRINITY_DN8846_c0_g1_i1.p1  ORF type:complete len:289 (-),score=62.36 TRINITY_DN8846_c0_g1_i1:173-1039(-)
MIRLAEIGSEILKNSDTDKKAKLTLEYCKKWKDGEITEVGSCAPPDQPSRPTNIKVLPPSEMPKRGKGGTLANRIAMLHSLVHIESVAIELAWDIIARFTHLNLPKEFYDDFVQVAEDEARHHLALKARLEELGSEYGKLPVHEGLWQSAYATKDDILARLAVEHMVHEARGLDVTPTTIERFKNGGDSVTAAILEQQIFPEEITHVAAGVKWFTYICERMKTENQTDHNSDPKQIFSEKVKQFFHGSLKPPFNVKARDAGGLTQEWYLPLSSTTTTTTKATKTTEST